MKKSILIVVAVVSIITILAGTSVVMAAKPSTNGAGKDVIAHSNGFPSGMHFNLNLHGRDCTTWTGDYTGNSIIIPLYTSLCGDATIEYLSNKKNRHATELVVIDPETEPFDGNSAQVYLPYNIDDDGDPETPAVSARGYYVFGRILGTPNNGSNDNESSLLLYSNSVIAASNSDNTSWPWYSDNTTIDDHIILDLGVITYNGQVGTTDPSGFYRFDPPTDDDENGKGNKQGKSKGVEITQLFLWSGWVVDASLDTDGNEVIDINDVPVADYGGALPGENRDYNNDGSENEDDTVAWLTDQSLLDPPLAWYFAPEDNTWIFDIAEMVISGQPVVNDGTKNFQIRFYPVETTEFTSEYIGP
ncbi:MAG: hypothetical protein PVG61_01265 [Dehalococcoidia bacterium]|jgi:hypothetical protein